MRRVVLLTLGMLGVGTALSFAPAGPPGEAPAAAQSARTVTVQTGPLTPGSVATVSWSGFAPGPAYVYTCQAVSAGLPAVDQCYGERMIEAQTGADGTGSTPFEVRSALAPHEIYGSDGRVTANLGGLTTVDCRSAGCVIVVTQCSASVSPAISAAGAYALPAADPGTYDDDPHADIEWREEDQGLEEPSLVASITPRPQPAPPVEPPPPAPVIATGPAIQVGGSDLGAAVFNRWNRRVAEVANVAVSDVLTTHREGIDSVVTGAVDFALSGVPATPEQVAAATANGQSLVYVPIALSSVALGFNAYPVLPLAELRVSPKAMAGLLWPAGQVDGNGNIVYSTLTGGALSADQGSCAPPRNRNNQLTVRGGASEANATISAWLTAAEPAYWKDGVVETLPTGQENLSPVSSHALVADRLVDPRQSALNRLDNYARLAITDTAWAAGVDAQLAKLQNEADRWVAPSPEGVLATLRDSTIGEDNIVAVNTRSPDPDAYPLVSVTYAVAPRNIDGSFSETDAGAVRQALSFYVSGEGQQLAEAQGFVPLTAELKARADAAIAQVGSVLPAAPAPETPTTETTAATTTDAPADATTGQQPAGGSPRGSAGSPAGGNAGSTNRPGTATPPRTATTVARNTTAPAADPAVDQAAAPAPILDGAPSMQRTTQMQAEAPPDVFSRLYDTLPFSPGLPTLAASGAAAAVVGQGLNLWRVARGRRGPAL